MDETWMTREQISVATGIPRNSIEREMLLAGINPRPETSRPASGTNVNEYLYPPETVERLNTSRASRPAGANRKSREAAHVKN